MNGRLRELVEAAGFVMWGDEGWAPKGAIIDWSSNYDEEVQRLVRAVVQECSAQCAIAGDVALAEQIKHHFFGGE